MASVSVGEAVGAEEPDIAPDSEQRVGYARLTAVIDPETGVARLVVFLAMAEMLVAYEAIRFSGARDQIRHHGGTAPPR